MLDEHRRPALALQRGRDGSVVAQVLLCRAAREGDRDPVDLAAAERSGKLALLIGADA